MTYDVVVVGAGVGGMAAAIRLGRRGYKVAVIEPNPPGTFRLGESLDWEAPVYLKRLGMCVNEMVACGQATWKGGAVATSSEQPGVEASFGFGPVYRFLQGLVGRSQPTIHANREEIDADMIRKVHDAGVTWITGRAKTIDGCDETTTVRGIDLADGRRIEGKYYLDAAGRGKLFRRRFGIGEDPMGPRKVVVRARFPKSYDGLGTRIRTDDTLTQPAWMWDISVTDEVTDIGIVVAQEDFAPLKKRLGSLKEVFLHQVKKHEDLAWLPPLVDDETDFWTCVFQDYASHKSHGPNWIGVGESVFQVDAILSSGYTAALRMGFVASDIVTHALNRDRVDLCPKMRHIYHAKTSAQVKTINSLIDVFWYRGRLRNHYSLLFNILSILTVNFNLNHLHTRVTPRSLAGLKMILALHKTLDRMIEPFDRRLTERAKKRRKVNPHRMPKGLDPVLAAPEPELVGAA